MGKNVDFFWSGGFASNTYHLAIGDRRFVLSCNEQDATEEAILLCKKYNVTLTPIRHDGTMG